MKILLVLNNTEAKNLRVMVQLTKKQLITDVVQMLEEDKGREAFDLIMREGEVLDYFPAGKRLRTKPAMTLNEDTL